jgi:predicted RNase H-like HicB family nuclease
MKYTYLAHVEHIAYVEKSGEGFGVFFPDVPGCISAGDTIEEALSGAHESLTLHIEGIKEDGDDLPIPIWNGKEETLDADYQGGDCYCIAAVTVETNSMTNHKWHNVKGSNTVTDEMVDAFLNWQTVNEEKPFEMLLWDMNVDCLKSAIQAAIQKQIQQDKRGDKDYGMDYGIRNH